MTAKTPALLSFVTFRLARLQNALNAQATALLKAGAGLSLVEWRVIQILGVFEDASLTELANFSQMDKGQLSRKINKMIDKGLLRTERDKDDQRVQHLRLTDAARRISKGMMPIMQTRQKRLLAEVTPQELETFYKVLDCIELAAKERDPA